MVFYEFLKNVPEGYKDFDYNYVRTLFDSLTGCIRCGTLSIKNNKCLACGFTKWNSKDFGFISEEEYNKEEQFDFFEPLDDEKIDINNRLEGAFLPDLT